MKKHICVVSVVISSIGFVAGCSLTEPMECQSGSTMCEKSGNGVLYQYCNAGKWESYGCNACNGNACLDLMTCSESDKPLCHNDESGIGQISTCVDSKIQYHPCPDDLACATENSCKTKEEPNIKPEEPTDKDCETENVQKCENTTENGDTYGVKYVCREGQWQVDAPCEGNALCDGNACSEIHTCQSPNIVCGNDQCINPNSDINYCGAKDDCQGANAGEVCLAEQKCAEGHCVCTNETQILCKTGEETKGCIDSKKSTEFCGCTADSMGMNCTELDHIANPGCENSVCTFTCAEGFGDCDEQTDNGCETDILNSSNGLNCGGCGDNFKCDIPNMVSASCVAGTCKYECADGYILCGDQCVKLDEDMNNCGWCGNACDESQEVCNAGFCVNKNTNSCERYLNNVKVKLLDGSYKTVNAFCVSNYQDLMNVANAVKNGEVYPSGNVDNAYILTEDIKLMSNWRPIGYAENTSDEGAPFSGIFLGNGKKITSDDPMIYYSKYALFGYTKNAVLDGFNTDYRIASSPEVSTTMTATLVGHAETTYIRRSVAHSEEMNAWKNAGILVGRADSGSLIELCRSSGYITSSATFDLQHTNDLRIGGLVGNLHHSEIKNCSSSAKVVLSGEYSKSVGGLVGGMSGGGIYSSWASGDVEGRYVWIGGLVGYVENVELEDGNLRSKIIDSHATGNVTNYFVTTTGDGVIGGLAGRVQVSDVDNCYATGKVTGGGNAGGLIGYLYEGASLKNSFATGEVVDAQHSGGLVGGTNNHATIDNCYATGRVTGVRHAGGLIANAYNTTISNSYSTGSVSLSGDVENNHYAGGFVGYVENCAFENNSTKSNTSTRIKGVAGGFVGQTLNSSYVRNQAYGNISSQGIAGGFAGVVINDNNTAQHPISENAAYGKSVKGNMSVGGFIGSAENYLNCKYNYTTANIEAISTNLDSSFGGFIGELKNTRNMTIDYNYSLGIVNSKNASYSGAFLGRFEDVTGPRVSNNYYYNQACTNSRDEALCRTGFGIAGYRYVHIYSCGAFDFVSDHAITNGEGTNTEAGGKVVDLLNLLDRKFVEAQCELTTAVVDRTVNIPVLIDMLPAFCQ